MSCCGRQGQRSLGNPRALARAHQPRRPPLPRAAPSFEYVGPTALTVVGPVTGKSYRFERSGSRLVVDPRDAPGIRAVPQLRRL